MLAIALHAIALAAPREVLVVYYTKSNHTKLLAEAIGNGARGEPLTNVRVKATREAIGDDLIRADAIIIGSPVHFGSQAAEFSRWIETTWTQYWQTGNLTGKLGAVFTTGGGLAQGLEFVLAELTRRLTHFRIDVVTSDMTWGAGVHSYGAVAVTGTDPWSDVGAKHASVAKVFLDAGAALGRSVAQRLAAKRRGGAARRDAADGGVSVSEMTRCTGAPDELR